MYYLSINEHNNTYRTPSMHMHSLVNKVRLTACTLVESYIALHLAM